jgi:hypothetical protein
LDLPLAKRLRRRPPGSYLRQPLRMISRIRARPSQAALQPKSS